MKNLATCKPTEFVAQTAKIKDAVANWVEVIELMKIRATQPNYETLEKGATAEKRAEVIKRNAELQKTQALENFSNLVDNMLVKHPKETLDVLALSCFVEPDHVDDYTIAEYMDCIMEMFENKAVLRFFSLLAQQKMPQKSI